MDFLRTTRSRILASFGINIAFTLLLGVVAVWLMGSVQHHLSDVTDNLVPSLNALSKISTNIGRVQLHTRRAVLGKLTKSPALGHNAREGIAEAFSVIDAEWKVYDSLPRIPEEDELWQLFKSRFEPWRRTALEIQRSLETNSEAEIEPLLMRAESSSKPMLETLDKVLALQSVLSKDWSEKGNGAANNFQRMVPFALLLSLLMSLGVALVMSKKLTDPLLQITRAARRIAQGDVDQKIEHQSSDEMGQLADSFRELVEYLRDMARAADALSKGNVGVELKPRSREDLLAANFTTAFATLRKLIDELRAFSAAAQAGELDKRVDEGRYHGVYRELIAEMNQLLASVAAPVKSSTLGLEKLARRDLTASMDGHFQGVFARKQSLFNEATQVLRESMSAVASAASQVAAASGQIASSSQDVASGASEQARSLEETSTSLEQMSSMTKQNATSAVTASQLAANAKSSSDQGSDAMVKMTTAMEAIRQAAQGTAAIIRDINDIAFQTNLLALNAAVEAARAGEAGRGFAVVAEEVRNLALRSKEAAKKTETLIHESVQLAQEGEQISKQVSVNLTSIVTAVSEVNGIINSISMASEEQSKGVEQVNRAVAAMDKVTQQNAASSEESSSAAQELSAQAQELTSLVGQFDIGDRRRPSAPRKQTAFKAQQPKPLAANGKAKNQLDTNGHADPRALIPFDDDPIFKDF